MNSKIISILTSNILINFDLKNYDDGVLSIIYVNESYGYQSYEIKFKSINIKGKCDYKKIREEERKNIIDAMSKISVYEQKELLLILLSISPNKNIGAISEIIKYIDRTLDCNTNSADNSRKIIQDYHDLKIKYEELQTKYNSIKETMGKMFN